MADPIDEEANGMNVADDYVMQGIRLSRSRTNWLYRGTSAITTSMRMDVDSLQEFYVDLETILACIAAAAAHFAALARVRLSQGIHHTHNVCKIVFNSLHLYANWISCVAEMALLDIEDLIYFVHTPHRFQEPTLRTINSIVDDNQSYNKFGFTKVQLQLLLIHWRIPSEVRQSN